MKAEKTLTWEKDGRTIEVKIERERGVEDNIVDADGVKINLGRKTVDALTIEVRVNGKLATRTYYPPAELTPAEKTKMKGAYARLGNIFVSEGRHREILATLADIEAELVLTPEYKEIREEETAKEATIKATDEAAEAEYQRLIECGMCPKCHTWCYGSCGR